MRVTQLSRTNEQLALAFALRRTKVRRASHLSQIVAGLGVILSDGSFQPLPRIFLGNFSSGEEEIAHEILSLRVAGFGERLRNEFDRLVIFTSQRGLSFCERVVHFKCFSSVLRFRRRPSS